MHGPKEKKTRVANWTSGPVCQCTGVVPAWLGQRLGGPCRRAPDRGACRSFPPREETAGGGCWGGSGHPVFLFPLPLVWWGKGGALSAPVCPLGHLPLQGEARGGGPGETGGCGGNGPVRGLGPTSPGPTGWSQASAEARKEERRPSVNHPTASVGTSKRGSRLLHLRGPARAGRRLPTYLGTGREQLSYMAKLDLRSSSRPKRLFSFGPCTARFLFSVQPKRENGGCIARLST